jgi:DNA-binding transcriptional LysR family regulator
MSSPSFQLLQSLLAVARLRSFSRAARELGVSRSAVSQAVRQLEEQLRVVLVARTTRSVSLTDAGRQLVERVAPVLGQLQAALTEVSARPGEAVGRLKISIPRVAIPLVVDPLVPAFRARHPRIDVEVVVEERLVDLVAEGYDAGVRLAESIERDMVQVRLTGPFRFLLVGAPSYLAQHGTPARPEDLLRHECITLRMQTTGTLYAWELERGKRSWRVPVKGGVVTNDSRVAASMAEQGVGLAYAFEPMVKEQLRTGRLKCVLEAYAPTVPGFFLYYPSAAQRHPPLRLFVAAAKELLVRQGAGGTTSESSRR